MMFRLYSIWSKAEKKVKFGGGFYCGALPSSTTTDATTQEDAFIYVFNPFFMDLRSKFIAPSASIHYYSVEFDPAKLSWAKFRGTGQMDGWMYVWMISYLDVGWIS